MVNITCTPIVASPATLADLTFAPQRVRTDEGTVEERPLPDLIQADVYNKLNDPALAKPLWGIAVASVRPPDALGQQHRDPWTPRML